MQPPLQRLPEPVLLELQRLRDQRFGAYQLGIGRPHLTHQRRHQPVHHRFPRAHHVHVPHRAPHDPAQHVTTPLVRWQHPIGNQERRAPQVIGHHAMADTERTVGFLPRGIRAGQDQRAENVDVVVIVLALQDRGEALQPHAGVDRGPRQRHARPGRAFLELHEHQVPDFDEPVAVFIGRARRTARDFRTVVVEDLRTRPARTGIAHAPEIRRGRDADDLLVREPGHLLPDRRRVIVLGEHRDQQAIRRQPVIPRHQLPRIGDGGFLEVVAEAEVPQHLEERVMPRGVADIVQVVVLAAGAHAFLRRRGARVGPLLLPGEHVLELHHPRVGEHQRGIVAWHQRRAFDHLVPITGKVVEEGGADVVAAGHSEPGSGKAESQEVAQPSCPCHPGRRPTPRRLSHRQPCERHPAEVMAVASLLTAVAAANWPDRCSPPHGSQMQAIH